MKNAMTIERLNNALELLDLYEGIYSRHNEDSKKMLRFICKQISLSLDDIEDCEEECPEELIIYDDSEEDILI